MNKTLVHIVDPSAAIILVQCADGARVLFGTHATGGTANEVVQRLFEILEDGQVDYLIHRGVDPDGVSIIEPLQEFFPIKSMLQLEANGFELPESCRVLNEDRPVETLESTDVFELGATQIRLLGAPEPQTEAGEMYRPVAMLVTHGETPTASSVLCCGATTGLDWLKITEGDDDLGAGCLVLDSARPLAMVMTAPSKGHVSADHLRRIAPSTILLGAQGEEADLHRLPARELYAHLARGASGGEGLVELDPIGWTSLELDGAGVARVQDERPMSKVA